MIFVAPYKHDTHYDLMVDGLQQRGAYVTPGDEVPKIGYVGFNGQKFLAMAFLRRVEGGFGQLDGLVSNPEAPGSERHEGIDIVVENVLRTAKELGIKNITATSVDSSTLMRSNKHGFVKLPHTLIAVNTSGDSK